MKKLFIFFLLIVVSCSNEDEDQICNEFELKLNCGEVIYPKESDSPYVLPWEVGKNYKVAQGNCTEGSHSYGSYNQFAYDFTMPIGTKIVAIRSGIVVGVEERNFDNEQSGIDASKNNYIKIKHEDGSEAIYLHMTYEGVLKEIGDNVAQGEVIALSGNSGWSSGPHLHLQVNNSFIQPGGGSGLIPITFNNTKPHCQGLLDISSNPDGYTAN
ncbi:MAG: hypothetical protein CMC04_11175 [Flavobacteriaceae bacterium]|nr:hypothetical protein [Flavobacteriaceae bacterium]